MKYFNRAWWSSRQGLLVQFIAFLLGVAVLFIGHLVIGLVGPVPLLVGIAVVVAVKAALSRYVPMKIPVGDEQSDASPI